MFFGWLKQTGPQRQVKLRGLEKVDLQFDLTGCGKTLRSDGGHWFSSKFDLSMSHARKRSEAGGDVQLFNLGVAHSSRASGAADSRTGRHTITQAAYARRKRWPLSSKSNALHLFLNPR
jgi:hypothetical protein